MTRLFKKIYNNDFSSIEGPALIIKNLTLGHFEVDEAGHSLESLGTAAVDLDNKICLAGIQAGQLEKVKEISTKNSKLKTKNTFGSGDEVIPTVASPEPKDSVQ